MATNSADSDLQQRWTIGILANAAVASETSLQRQVMAVPVLCTAFTTPSSPEVQRLAALHLALLSRSPDAPKQLVGQPAALEAIRHCEGGRADALEATMVSSLRAECARCAAWTLREPPGVDGTDGVRLALRMPALRPPPPAATAPPGSPPLALTSPPPPACATLGFVLSGGSGLRPRAAGVRGVCGV